MESTDFWYIIYQTFEILTATRLARSKMENIFLHFCPIKNFCNRAS